MRVGIVGCGKAGTALAAALGERRGRVRLAGLLSRSHRRSAALARRHPGAVPFRSARDLAEASDTVLLCVPDDAIAAAAGVLAESGSLAGLCALHLSGAHGVELLEPARRAGASVGTLHPLAPLAARPGREPGLAGAWFSVGGQRRAVAAARRIVSHLGGHVLAVPEGARPAYHLAATIVANHSTILSAVALDLLERRGGIEGARVRRAFASLLRATAANLEDLGPRRALTGPASRADVETLRRHLELMEGEPEELSRLYRMLSRMGVDIAAARGGLDPARARRARKLLGGRKRPR